MRGPHHSPCTRAHQAAALLLIAATFFLSRLLHRPLSAPPPPCAAPPPPDSLWAHRDLRIYVYAKDEVGGLRAAPWPQRRRPRRHLPQGPVGNPGEDPPAPPQLEVSNIRQGRSRSNAFECVNFFVPTYVKCVRMTGALNDKEINQTYVKVLSQMPYFRRSGGRDHIFVFPSGA